MLQGTKTWLLANADGQIELTHSVSAGLDYAAIGPEHAYLHDIGRVEYTYATDKEMADAELALLKTALTGKTFELPISVDVEDNKIKKMSTQALTDLAAYALATVERWGFYALLYVGLNFAQTELCMGGAALRKYDVWLARYPRDKSKTKPEDKPKADFSFGMWQYTSTASVPGITGNVDLNVTTLNYPRIIEKKGLTRLREGA